MGPFLHPCTLLESLTGGDIHMHVDIVRSEDGLAIARVLVVLTAAEAVLLKVGLSNAAAYQRVPGAINNVNSGCMCFRWTDHQALGAAIWSLLP